MAGDGRIKKYISLCLFTFLIGLAGGGIIWILLQIMQVGISLLWTALPNALGLSAGAAGLTACTPGTLIYNMAVCFTGAIFIALTQKHYGPLPETMEEVMFRVKQEGSYPFGNLHHIAIAALLPLIFGGALGPEAGLTGLIVGFCYWAGANLKYRNEEITALAEAGFAAMLGVIFGSPLFGIAHNLEPDDKSEHYLEKLAGKRTRWGRQTEGKDARWWEKDLADRGLFALCRHPAVWLLFLMDMCLVGAVGMDYICAIVYNVAGLLLAYYEDRNVFPELMKGLGKGVKSFKDGMNGAEEPEIKEDKEKKNDE